MGKRGKQRKRKGKTRPAWVTTAIPRALADRARKWISKHRDDYTGLTKLTEDALRRRVEELEKLDQQVQEAAAKID